MKRFYELQRQDFEAALEQVSRGYKSGHWIWYIFPQLRGLGQSHMSYIYGIAGLEEARAFAADPYLGGNLRRITRALLDQPVRSAHTVFGHTDAMKLRSCMTLFELADPECPLYSRVLEEFFGGNRDRRTLDMLK